MKLLLSPLSFCIAKELTSPAIEDDHITYGSDSIRREVLHTWISGLFAVSTSNDTSIISAIAMLAKITLPF